MEQLWWGYLHTNGQIQVKRYFNYLDIKEANESPFVMSTMGPFEAESRAEAIKKMQSIRILQRSLK